ncbi:MAG: pyridoxal phosphate-dependent class II aminotransferase [Culturomica sp.]|jgi:threonine-phosphate decarboxylase|nr:pyridoxal phosphate-dependent class II aminotransferase [Culturomica sp.]
MINGHGDDIYGCKRKIISNFSSNIYGRQDFSALHDHLCSCIHSIHAYPEPDAASLVELLAKKNDIQTANILVTNGAVEAIYLIAQAFRAKKSSIIIPAFSEYEDACRIHEHQLSFASSLSQTDKEAELIWLCNPNNPDGNVYHKSYLDTFISEHPDIFFIIDQSYEAFTDKQYTFTVRESLAYKNVILLHSMTKSYAIPGLRLGYITACNELTDKISAFRIPWAVNQLAIEAGKYLLKEGKPAFDPETYLAETKHLMTALNAIDGLTVLPASTHFFLCKLIRGKASDLKQYLIDQHGILIRDASNFRGLDASFFRIATQSREENDQLVKAIKEWI